MTTAAITLPVTRQIKLPQALSFAGTALAFVGITFAAGAPSPLFVVMQQQWGFPAWVLTIAFAIYAIGLLAALLVAGSLSDHIGRRPVLLGALAIEIVAMVMFVLAPNISWIILARALQGIATGAATSTFTATIVELAPANRKKLGTIISSTAPVGGLGLGALATGIAVQFSHYPTTIIFGFLTVLFAVGVLVTVFSRETVSPRPGALRSLLPRLSVPVGARPEFAASIPVHIATWMLAGLVLGLAPSIIREVFHLDSGLLNGTLVALQPLAAVVSSLALSRLPGRRVILIGTLAVMLGVSLFLVAVVTGFFPLLFGAVIIGGGGFGATFSGSLRLIAPLADVHQRAELFAAVYLVSYLAYGVPALLVGELIGVVGLFDAVIGYVVAILFAAAIGLLAQSRLARSQARRV